LGLWIAGRGSLWVSWLMLTRKKIDTSALMHGYWTTLTSSGKIAVKQVFPTIFGYSDRLLVPMLPGSIFGAFYIFNYIISLVVLIFDTVLVKARAAFFTGYRNTEHTRNFLVVAHLASIGISILPFVFMLSIGDKNVELSRIQLLAAATLAGSSFLIQSTPTFANEILFRLTDGSKLQQIGFVSLLLCIGMLLLVRGFRLEEGIAALVACLLYYLLCNLNGALLMWEIHRLTIGSERSSI